MGRHFPVSWGEWQAGTENAYQLQEVLEARMAIGQTLSMEEQSLLTAVRRVTSRYERSGHKKRKGRGFAPPDNQGTR